MVKEQAVIENNVQVVRKVWLKPEVTVVLVKQSEATLSLNGFDGVLYS